MNYLLEATIYQPSTGGFIPHIKWSTNLIKGLGGNQIKGLNNKLRTMFPEVITKLAELGIDSSGREMYAKSIGIDRVFESESEAMAACSIYQSIINEI